MRGSIEDYAMTAERILAPGGVFAFVCPADTVLKHEGLKLVRKLEVIFKEGEPPMIALFAASRER